MNIEDYLQLKNDNLDTIENLINEGPKIHDIYFKTDKIPPKVFLKIPNYEYKKYNFVRK